MNNQQQSFLDPKTIIAIVLVGVCWLGWQVYMKKKYPESYSKPPTQEQTETKGAAPDTKSESTPVAAATAPAQSKNDEIAEKIPQQETLVHHDDENLSFDISSRGMGIKNVKLNQYTDREKKPILLGDEKPFLTLETNLLNRTRPLYFQVQKESELKYVGVAEANNSTIKKTIEIDPQQYNIKTTILVSHKNSDSFSGITTYLTDKLHEQKNHSFLLPSFEHQEFYILQAEGSHHRKVLMGTESLTESYSQSRILSLGTQYFTQALVDESAVNPEVKLISDHNAKAAYAIFNYPIINRAEDFKVTNTLFIGPKSYHTLKAVNEDLAQVIDFGWFSFIAKYILYLMKWFYSWLGNWGFAIILLTIIVRFLVLPFSIVSYRSMKAMQKVQPEINRLKEKYKDDKMRQNQELMLLMKNNNVNPLGGCLPLLLQFPIFIALYRVLGQSIELYQAPFIFWIHDLSFKDPFYVLPILMGITMFIQQKITPTTMDPAQAKVLMFMPVIFSFFMLGLPSGLTLYIFVSTLFGICQQLYFMRDSKQTT